MSFLDNTKNFGIVLLIIAILDIAVGVISFIGLSLGDQKIDPNVLAGVGAIIDAVLVGGFALGVMKGEYFIKVPNFIDNASTKFGVLTGFLSVEGISSIIGGILSLDFFGIIIGVLFLVVVFLMVTKKGTSTKIIYWVLLVLFILMIISGILSLIVLVGIPILLMGLMLLVYLMSPEVKAELGVN